MQETFLQPTDNLRKLHENLSSKEGFSVPFEQFEQDMQNEENLRKLHFNLTKKEGFSVPYDRFKQDMFTAHAPEKKEYKLTKDDIARQKYNGVYEGEEDPEEEKGFGDWAKAAGAGFLGTVVKTAGNVGIRLPLLGPEIVARTVIKQSGDYTPEVRKALLDIMMKGMFPVNAAALEGYQYVSKSLEEESDFYGDKDYEDFLNDKDYKNVIGDVMLEGARSLPITIGAAFNKPATLIATGASTAIDKYDELDTRADLNEFQKISNAVLTGSIEAGTDLLGSVPVGRWLRSIYKKVGKETAEEIVKKGFQTWINNQFKKYGLLIAPIAEGVEEVVNAIGSGVTDWVTGVDPDAISKILQNAKDGFVYGFGGGVQGSMMAIPGEIYNRVQKRKEENEERKIVDYITQTTNQFVNPNTGKVHVGMTAANEALFILGETEDGTSYFVTDKTSKGQTKKIVNKKDFVSENIIEPKDFITNELQPYIQQKETKRAEEHVQNVIQKQIAEIPEIIETETGQRFRFSGDPNSLLGDGGIMASELDENDEPIGPPVEITKEQIDGYKERIQKKAEEKLKLEEDAAKEAERLAKEAENNQTVTDSPNGDSNVSENVDETGQNVIPVDKNGNPDYDLMEPDMFMSEFGREFGEEEAVKELEGLRKAAQQKIAKLEAKKEKSTSMNERASILKEIKSLSGNIEKISGVIGKQAEVAKEKQEQKKLTELDNKKNGLVRLIKMYNNKQKRQRTSQETALIMKVASDLGYKIAQDRMGNIVATNKEGKRLIEKSERRIGGMKLDNVDEEYRDIVSTLIPNSEFIQTGLGPKETRQAIDDIKAGKTSVPAQTLLESLQKMAQDGVVTFKGNRETGQPDMDISVDEYFDSIMDEVTDQEAEFAQTIPDELLYPALEERYEPTIDDILQAEQLFNEIQNGQSSEETATDTGTEGAGVQETEINVEDGSVDQEPAIQGGLSDGQDLQGRQAEVPVEDQAQESVQDQEGLQGEQVEPDFFEEVHGIANDNVVNKEARQAENDVNVNPPEAVKEESKEPVKNQLAEVLFKYEDTGEIETISDLIYEIENIENLPVEISNAIEEYREEEDQDFREYAGRGDMESAQEKFLDIINKYFEESEQKGETDRGIQTTPKVETPEKLSSSDNILSEKDGKVNQIVKETPSEPTDKENISDEKLQKSNTDAEQSLQKNETPSLSDLFQIEESPEEKRIKEKLSSLTLAQRQDAKKGIDDVDAKIKTKRSEITRENGNLKTARKTASEERQKAGTGMFDENTINSLPVIQGHMKRISQLQKEYFDLLKRKESLIDTAISTAKMQGDMFSDDEQKGEANQLPDAGQKEKEEREFQRQQEEAAKQAKVEANKGKSKLELMNEAKNEKALNKLLNYEGNIKTRKQFIEDSVREGKTFKIGQENKIKDVTRSAYNRMNGRQQEEFEKRQKEAGLKNVYKVVDTDGSYYEITKAEYDYAIKLQQQSQPVIKEDFGKSNTTFTEDAAKAAIERLKKSMGQLNAGIDPQNMVDMVTVAGYYIEGGARKFTDFVKQMTDTLGNWVQPYLKGLYENIRRYPGMETVAKEMDSTQVVDEYFFEENSIPKEVLGAQSIINEYGPSLSDATEEMRKEYDNAISIIKNNGYYIELGKLIKGERPDPIGNKSKEEKLKDFIFIIKQSISAGIKIKNTPQLTALANRVHYTQGVDYTDVKELYDIASFALNEYFSDNAAQFNPQGKTAEQVKEIVEILNEKMNLLPTETTRSADMVEKQQFSTPPAFAFVANWAAQVNQSDTVLEPSAGEGNIAVFAKNTGANVVVNEIDKKRSSLLNKLFSRVLNEDAKHLHAIAALKSTPVTTVVMNPPFSRDIVLGNKLDIHAAEKHMEAALNKLEEGGRLVAIVGRGMSMDSHTNQAWFNKIAQRYNIKANILVSGDAYSKKGTNFDNRLIIIDNNGETYYKEVLTGEVNDYSELVDLISKVSEKQKLNYNEINNRTSSKGKTSSTTNTSLQTGQQSGTANDVSAGRSGRSNAGQAEIGGLFNQPVDATNTGSGSVSGNKPATSRTTSTAEKRGVDERIPDTATTSRSVEPETRQLPDTKIGELKVSRQEKKLNDSGNVGYDQYVPEITIEGSKPHPTKLVESTAMASVSLPEVDYTPQLPVDKINEGALSDAQLEDVILAGNSHKQVLPDGKRRGFFLGAGTGYGKGRTIAAIILDNYNQGRKKAVWISKNDKAHYDSADYWEAVGGDPKVMFEQKSGTVPIAPKEGVLLSKYGTLSNKFDKRKDYSQDDTFWTEKPQNRLQQMAQWLGKDFDGVIVFDESHKMANAKDTKGARGSKKASSMALAGLELQRLLPNARVVYSSATGATEVTNLVYAQRLGLWGDGTPFSQPGDFIQAVENSGVAGMELISRDLKAMGLYTAKTLSFDGVQYDTVTHDLMPEQKKLYDKVARAWQKVLDNINNAIEENNTGKNAKSAAMSAFWGAHQRFFSNIIITMQMPSLLNDIQENLANDKAIVVQLVNTNEAATKRALAEAKLELEEGEEVDYDEMDVSPKQSLIEFLRRSFPVALFETTIDENGNEIQVMVRDSEGNPVENPTAVKRRDNLIAEIDREIQLPESPLDILINTFGAENVAEITGRSSRIVSKQDESGNYKKVEESRSNSSVAADKDAFMDGKKNILVFSDAGGTGASFHSDLKRKNQKQRVHYVLQAGWRADGAVQGFGRSHRSNQAVPPIFKLVTTNLKAQRRFLSSIARRLDQLGALTKGQRQTGGQGILDGSFNLEGEYAKQALFNFYVDVENGKVDGVDMNTLEKQMALKIYVEDNGGNRKYNDQVVFNTKMFLNRLMSLEVDLMDDVFEGFMSRLEEEINIAKTNGTYDEGIEVVKALSTKVVDEQEIYSDDKTGAKTYITTIELEVHNEKTDFDSIISRVERYGNKFKGFFREEKSGRIYALVQQDVVRADGERQTKYRRFSVVADSFIEPNEFYGKYQRVDEPVARESWNKEFTEYPNTRKKTEYIVKGLILPIWNRLPEKINVKRYVDNDGNAHLGRSFSKKDIEVIRSNFEVASSETYTADKLVDVLNKDGYVKLSNGFELTKKSHQGNTVFAITNANSYRDRERLTRAGASFVVKSSMSMSGDFVVPAANASEVIQSIIEMYNAPAIEVEDSEGNHVMGERTAKKSEPVNKPHDPNVSIVRIGNQFAVEVKRNLDYKTEYEPIVKPLLAQHNGYWHKGLKKMVFNNNEDAETFKTELNSRIFDGQNVVNEPGTIYTPIQTQINWGEDVPFKRPETVDSDPSMSEVQLEAGYSPDHSNSVTFMEMQLSDKGFLNFMGDPLTGPAKIKSANDVAFLFKNLEKASSENLFVVHMDNKGNYKVQYVATGTQKGVIIDILSIITAAKEFGTTRLLYVHNHPSGNLQQSKADLEINDKLDDAAARIGITVLPGIIINLDSGKFSEIGDYGSEVRYKTELTRKVKKQKVYQFDRQKLYIPSSERTKITQSIDAAEFLSKQKRGIVSKVHVLILNNANQINKYIFYDGNITTPELLKELLPEIGKHGDKVIIASNGNPNFDIKLLNKKLNQYDSKVLDYLIIKQDEDIVRNYESYLDEGLGLSDSESKYKNEAKEPENDIRFRKVSPDGFYSTVESALEQIKQEKGTTEQFKAMLLKNGAKQAEMDWMGWDDFASDINVVTKTDIQKWIDENRIEVEEVVKGEIPKSAKLSRAEALRELDRGNAVYGVDTQGQESLIETLDDLDRYDTWVPDEYYETDRQGGFVPMGDTKYSKYQEPGGSNYKEVLLTMPEKQPVPTPEELETQSQSDYKKPYSELSEIQKSEIKKQVMANKGYTKDYSPKTFKSSHFEEPNILAHIRFNEREVNGERVLFLEEIQSDFSQAVRKGTTTAKTPFEKTDQWVNLAFRRMMRYAAENGFDRIAWTNGEMQAARYDLSKQVSKIQYWKSSDEGYTGLSIYDKRGSVIMGYDASDFRNNELEGIVGKEIATKILNDDYSKGEEVRTIEGDNLKVGGSGMKAFYDAIVPSAASKLGKPFGAKVEPISLSGKAPYELTAQAYDGTQDIESLGEQYVQDGDYVIYANGKPIHVIDEAVSPEDAVETYRAFAKDNGIEIQRDLDETTVMSIPVTESMRESVMHGVPLFKKVQTVNEPTAKNKEVFDALQELQSLAGNALPLVAANNRVEIVKAMEENGARKETINLIKNEKFVAFVDTSTGHVYVDMSKVRNRDEAIKTWLHENGGHFGIRNLIPNRTELNEFFDVLYDSVLELAKTNPLYRKVVEEVEALYGDISNREAADEFFAHLAEKVNQNEVLNPAERSIWQKLVEGVRNILSKVFKFDGKLLTHQEISIMVRAAIQTNFQQNDRVQDQMQEGGGTEASNNAGDTKGSYRDGGSTGRTRRLEPIGNILHDKAGEESLFDTAENLRYETGRGDKGNKAELDRVFDQRRELRQDGNMFQGESGEGDVSNGILDDRTDAIQKPSFDDYDNVVDYAVALGEWMRDNVRFAKVFHGSPHTFDKFDTKKIGTGEGEQAYGWGLYFTDKESIAYEYAKNLGAYKPKQQYKGIDVIPQSPLDAAAGIINDYQNRYNTIPKAIRRAQELRNYVEKDNLKMQKYWDDVIDWLKHSKISDFKKVPNRNVYSVKIHGDKTIDELNFLRWDKPISNEQKTKIIEQANKEDIRKFTSFEDYKDREGALKKAIDKLDGSSVYSYFQSYLGNPENASKFLLRAGIDGIQYPTEFRTKKQNWSVKEFNKSDGEIKYSIYYNGKPHYDDRKLVGFDTKKEAEDYIRNKENFNYVVFDENAIEIESSIRFKKELPSTITINGVERPTTNNNGQPIADSEEKIRNFYKWFGDSRVVDEEGRPLVVYHGTRGDFDVFGKGVEASPLSHKDRLWYFTNDLKTANIFAGGSKKAFKNIGSTGSVLPVYLSVKNPNILNHKEQDSQDAIEDVGYWATNEQLDNFQNRGFDGIMLDDFSQIIAMSPTQIKSATGNIGTFDPDNGDIRFKKQPKYNETVVKSATKIRSLLEKGQSNYFNVEDSKGNTVKIRVSDHSANKQNNVDEKILSFITERSKQRRSAYNQMVNEWAIQDNGLTDTYEEIEDILSYELDFDDIRFKKTASSFDQNPEVEGALIKKPSKTTIKEISDGIRDVIQDRDLKIRRFIEEIGKRGGKMLENAYRDKTLAFGRAETLHKQFDKKLVNPIIESLKEFKKAGITNEGRIAYTVAKHAPERNAKIRGDKLREWEQKNSKPEDGPALIEWENERTDFEKYIQTQDYSGLNSLNKDENVSPDEFARQQVKLYEKMLGKETVDAYWKALKEANKFTLDRWLAANMINKKEYDEMLTGYENYVPLKGWWNDKAKEIDFHSPMNSGKSLKHAEGRKTMPDDPIASLMHQAFKSISEQVENEVKQSMLKFMVQNMKGNEDMVNIKRIYYVQDPVSGDWNYTTEKPAKDAVDTGIAKTVYYTEHFRERKPGNAKEHEVVVDTPDGTFIMVFDNKWTEVGMALNNSNNLVLGLDSEISNKFLGSTIGKFTNLQKMLFTSWNIVFPLTNFSRDIPEAFTHIMISRGPVQAGRFTKDVPLAFKTASKYLAGGKFEPKYDNNGKAANRDAHYKDWLEIGGMTGFTHQKDTEQLQKEIKRRIKRMGSFSIEDVTKAAETFSEIFENNTRFAAYLSGVESGMSKKDAALLSKEVSVNFNRKGKMSKSFDSVYAFFNAAMQGATKGLKLAKDYPVKFVAAATVWTTMGFIFAELNRYFDDDDEDEFENLNRYVRMNYLTFPIGDGKYGRIPLPQFWRAFYALGSNLSDYNHNKQSLGMAIGQSAGNLANALLPIDVAGLVDEDGSLNISPIVPTAVKPLVEAYVTNRNFMNYPIAHEAFTKDLEQRLASHKLHKKNVNPAIKFITDGIAELAGADSKYKYYYTEGRLVKGMEPKQIPGIFDINPSKVEHLITAYSGGTGKFLTDLITTGYQIVSPTEEVKQDNMPYVNAFIRKYPEAKYAKLDEYRRMVERNKRWTDIARDKKGTSQDDEFMNIMTNDIYRRESAAIKVAKKQIEAAKTRVDNGNITVEEFLDLTAEIKENAINRSKIK